MRHLVVLFVMGLATVALAQDGSPGWPVSSATSDNIFSVAANPAGMGVERDSEFLFSWRVNDAFPDDRNEYSFLISGNGLGFGFYEVYSPERDDIVRKYQIASGGHLGGGFYLGARADWWARFPDQKMQFDAGLLYRPFNFFSLGFTASNLFEANDGYRTFEPGVAIRPLAGDSRLTLYASGTLFTNDSLDYGEEFPYRLGIEVEPLPGLSVAGTWESEGETIGLAASFSTDFASVFSSQQLVDEDEATLRAMGVHFTKQKRHSVTDMVHTAPSEFVEIKLAGSLPYFSDKKGFFQKPSSSVRQLLDFLQELTEKQDAAGIFLHLNSPALGATSLREVAAAFQAYRDAGGLIYTFIESGGLGAYYLAAHTDKIYLPETSSIDLQGIAIESMFFSGLLDKLGLEMEVIAAGKYKSAMEQFSREGFSDPAREALDAVVTDLLDAFINGIATARGLSPAAATGLVLNGPYNCQAAIANGMIDGSMYYHDREEMLKGGSGLEEITLTGWHDFYAVEDYQYAWGVDTRPQHIALIRAEGPVMNLPEPQRSIFETKKQVTYQIADQLKIAREDENVAAVVLWINSPGGAILASDVIWHEMKKYHTGDVDKPIIAVMGDVAGSGGVYFLREAGTR
ncbi:S49 family peptidase [bacterium]|nr:S49 family peptidase [bacterium]